MKLRKLRNIKLTVMTTVMITLTNKHVYSKYLKILAVRKDWQSGCLGTFTDCFRLVIQPH